MSERRIRQPILRQPYRPLRLLKSSGQQRDTTNALREESGAGVPHGTIGAQDDNVMQASISVDNKLN